MTCVGNWIKVRKRCTASTSLSLPDLTALRGKTKAKTSWDSEPGAMDVHSFFCVLLRNACMLPYMSLCRHLALNQMAPSFRTVIANLD